MRSGQCWQQPEVNVQDRLTLVKEVPCNLYMHMYMYQLQGIYKAFVLHGRTKCVRKNSHVFCPCVKLLWEIPHAFRVSLPSNAS